MEIVVAIVRRVFAQGLRLNDGEALFCTGVDGVFEPGGDGIVVAVIAVAVQLFQRHMPVGIPQIEEGGAVVVDKIAFVRIGFDEAPLVDLQIAGVGLADDGAVLVHQAGVFLIRADGAVAPGTFLGQRIADLPGGAAVPEGGHGEFRTGIRVFEEDIQHHAIIGPLIFHRAGKGNFIRQPAFHRDGGGGGDGRGGGGGIGGSGRGGRGVLFPAKDQYADDDDGSDQHHGDHPENDPQLSRIGSIQNISSPCINGSPPQAF